MHPTRRARARLKVGERSFHASPCNVQDVKMLEGGGSLPYRGSRLNESFAGSIEVYIGPVSHDG